MGKLYFLLIPLIVFAEQREGEKIYMSMGCYGCHGVRGEGIGDYPKIGGKPAEYLKTKLHNLQKGIGYTSKRDLMIPFAKGLDERQIDAVSLYLSRIDPHSSTDGEEDVPDDILGGFGS